MSDLGNKEVMARNIKYYLKANDVTQTEMCNTLGFKMSTVSDWMHARTYPRIDKIEMMANYFGIEKSDLVEKKSSSAELNKRDTKQIEEILQQTKDKLTSQEGLMFDGDPASPEAIESILNAMEWRWLRKRTRKNIHLKNTKRTDVNGHKKDCKFACQETQNKKSF